MPKKEIAREIAARLDQPTRVVEAIVREFLREATIALASDGRLELRNFGVFDVRESKARTARNPRTGEPVAVPPKRRVAFQAGKELLERVRGERPAERQEAEGEREADVA
jgi:nucleoid DNA-binding protein